MKPIKSAALQGQKLSQSALNPSERTTGNINVSRGRSPEPPLREGECPFSCFPPTCAFGTRKTSLIFHGRTTFQKPTTALVRSKISEPLMRKPTICLGENKGADQFPGKHEADQDLCFRYMDCTIPLLSLPKISSL